MRFILLFSALLLTGSCAGWKNAKLQKRNEKLQQKNAGSKTKLSVAVTVENLAEDLSIFATHNDEIVFLVYEFGPDTNAVPSLLISEYQVFDSIGEKKEFVSDSFALLANGQLDFVMLEIDGNKNLEQIEPIVRLNLQKIKRAYETNNDSILTVFFGDDDVLGVDYAPLSTAENGKENEIIVSGVHFFDKYYYRLEYSLLLSGNKERHLN
ncbi:MAG: hypothetical protein HY064_09580 [Bacteroidetes bacterium]|nr:hypothetical protein [Bacteroidota bacterium]